MKLSRPIDGKMSADDPLFRHLLSRAELAGDAGDFSRAAVLYAEALNLDPSRTDLVVQRARALQDFGDMEAAEVEYLRAYDGRPDDAALALQIGRFYKASGRLSDAQTYYHAALRLRPRWSEATDELRQMSDRGWVGRDPIGARSKDPAEGIAGGREGMTAVQIAKLAPALVPRDRASLFRDHGESLEVRRFGTPEYGYWGVQRTFRGVQAIRGFCVSTKPVSGVKLLLNGLTAFSGPVSGGYELAHERDKTRIKKYVFNIWLDFSAFACGRYDAEILCLTTGGKVFSFSEKIVVAAPDPDGARARSAAFVPLQDSDPASLEQRIRTLPTMANPARRSLLPEPPHSILVMRTDQMGDMVSSTAAVRRLREIFPGARVVGLVTSANVDLARTLGLFEDVIVANFPDDEFERVRVMPLAEQEALRLQLASYHFDMAIDLAQASVSRELLLLSGAPFLYGVGGGDWPWLTAEFGLNTHDTINRLDVVPHSSKTLALIETLGTLFCNSFEIMRRTDLERDRLTELGLSPHDRFVVLHMGARLVFSRWPHFAQLAQEVLRRTGLKVVMITEDPHVRSTLPHELTESDRFVYFDKRLTFDHFDTLVSFAEVLVGNDSGPKHLAALRGTHVVTLFTARINWQEWGQEEVGTIMSRQVPCAGCAIFHDPEECGKDFCCIRDIRVKEVFTAMKIAS